MEVQTKPVEKILELPNLVDRAYGVEEIKEPKPLEIEKKFTEHEAADAEKPEQ